MIEKQMVILFKSMRIPYVMGQVILLGSTIYFYITKNDFWPYPAILFSLEQVVYWSASFYYSKQVK